MIKICSELPDLSALDGAKRILPEIKFEWDQIRTAGEKDLDCIRDIALQLQQLQSGR
ncbi:MAG: hypothetical protein JXR86_13705 [Spirochaetales bacterium]|nr:hypothetical protein [Spirochaetales bacterium]